MAYTINKFNGTVLSTIEDGTVDQTTNLKLIGKNYAGYGEAQNENMLFLLENFSSSAAPTRPVGGQLWYDSSVQKLKLYNSTATTWRPVGGAQVLASAPSTGTAGDFYWNTTTGQLFTYNDSNTWTLVGPQATDSSGTTQMQSRVLKATTGVNHPVIVSILNDVVVHIISNTGFTIDSTSAITGFDIVQKGLTLKDTKTATGGVTSSDYRLWGTSSNALKLGGLPSSSFLQSVSPQLTGTTKFADGGYTLGTSTALTVSVSSSTPTFKMNNNKFNITDSAASSMLAFGAASGGDAAYWYTDGTVNLGSSTKKWGAVYSDSFKGTADQANTLRVDNGDVTLATSYAVAATAASVNTIAARDSSGNLTAVLFSGTATQARYADLAEKYTTDKEYLVGTAMCVGGTAETTAANSSCMCIGVISADPAYLMNSEAEGQAIGLKGRVPVRCNGVVKKGEAVYAWQDGVCSTIQTTAFVGIALESSDVESEKLVECVLKV